MSEQPSINSTEHRAHQEIADLIQAIWNRDRIRIAQVNVTWIDLTVPQEHRYIMTGIHINSDAFPPFK